MGDFDPEAPEYIAEGDDTLAHGFPTLRSILMATGGFWLILAWAVWHAW